MDFLDSVIVSDSFRQLKEGYCIRDALVQTAMRFNNGKVSVEFIVRAAIKCSCKDCEAALQHYARSELHKEFTRED